jgi:UDP-3-O-[3-hydroxymyristoyl] N-acetylglucosamine deacetylase/3-hydroxyacyl-[acyl-carrier-protein] dehydratase
MARRADVSYSRNTIAGVVSCEGVGLHFGNPVRITFKPAPGGSGINFVRLDLPDRPRLPARADLARLAERRTQLGDGPTAIHTVEHVLAALAGSQVDDVEIELDAAEPPIMDGSAAPFFEALLAVGVVPSGTRSEYLKVTRSFDHSEGNASYRVLPACCLELDVTVCFEHRLVGEQRGHWCVDRDVFGRELARARTFGFRHEVEALRSQGLIKGASTANAVLLDEDGVVENTLRWPDEFVRHKALDCLGDLALAGRRLQARIVARRPSHRGTVSLVKELVRRDLEEQRVIDIDEIMRTLPHRYPFLLVDRVLEYESGKRVVGIKNVTINEPFFQGHFPGHAIMPGVLIIEAMAQVGGILLMGTVENPETKVVYFTSLDNVRWRKPVRPGDQLRFELEVLQIRGQFCRMKGVALVDGSVVAEAEMSAMLRDK